MELLFFFLTIIGGVALLLGAEYLWEKYVLFRRHR